MDNSCKKRQSNIELLRIVSILMIISFHYVYKGGFYFENISVNFLIVKAFWFLGELGVNLFVLIMGYFMINSEFKIRKLLLLLLEVLFYHLTTLLIASRLGIYVFPKGRDLFLVFFPTTLNSYWFITVYIILYILSPYLNQFIKSCSRTMLKRFLMTVLIIYSVIPTFFGLFYNTTEGLLYYNRLIWLSIIYFLGAYIRLYSFFYIENIKKSIWGGIAAFSICMISVLIIKKFSFFAWMGTIEPAYFWPPNTVPMLMMSIGVFGIFIHLHIDYCKIINVFASTTLGVYLMHDGILQGYLWNNIFKNAEHQDSPYLILYILSATIVIFLVGALIDLCRQIIEKKVIIRALDKCFQILERVRGMKEL